MKLLLDTCISPRTLKALEAAGHDAVWTGNWPADPGDEVILDTAYKESRILITLDKDFGELAVVFGKPHCGIVRLVDIRPELQTHACETVLERYSDVLAAGAIVTVGPNGTRLRPPEEDHAES